jgi:dihydrofolate reductase
MGKVSADISMSLDGYVTAVGADQEHGLGIGGEAIHAWVPEEPRSPVDDAVLAQSFEQTGAVVMGRRLYDMVDGPNGWNADADSTPEFPWSGAGWGDAPFRTPA